MYIQKKNLTDSLPDAHVLVGHKLRDVKSPLLRQLPDAAFGTDHLQPRAAEVRLGPEHRLLLKLDGEQLPFKIVTRMYIAIQARCLYI